MKKHREFHELRSKINEKILTSGFNDFKKFFALDTKAYHDSKIPSNKSQNQ
jgi:hypothetical protein